MPFTFAYPVFDIKKNKHGRSLLSQQSGKYTASGGIYYKKSIYYWWWVFFKLSVETKHIKFSFKNKNTKVQKDFGDIRNKTFKKWWFEKVNGETRGEYLFSYKQLDKVKLSSKILKHKDFLNILIPLKLPKRAIKRQINAIIKKYHTSNRGALKKKDRIKAKYTPTNNKVRAYEKLYLLASIIENNQKLKHKEIWFKCLDKDNKFSKVNAESINVDSINGNVSRLIKKLKRILFNVQNGKF